MRYIVCWGYGRLKRKTGVKPIVWCVREDTPAKTLVATFATEDEAKRFAAVENFDDVEAAR